MERFNLETEWKKATYRKPKFEWAFWIIAMTGFLLGGYSAFLIFKLVMEYGFR